MIFFNPIYELNSNPSTYINSENDYQDANIHHKFAKENLTFLLVDYLSFKEANFTLTIYWCKFVPVKSGIDYPCTYARINPRHFNVVYYGGVAR